MPLKMPVKYVAASREKVLGNLRRAYGSKPDFDKTRFIAERLLRETSDRNTQIDCLISLAQVSNRLGNTTEALGFVDKAVDLARGIRESTQLARIRYVAGSIYVGLPGEDKLKIALSFFLQAKEAVEKVNDKRFLANILGRIGSVLIKQARQNRKKGKLGEAKQKLDESLRVHYVALELEKEIGVVGDLSSSYGAIALVKQEQGKFDEAIELIQKFCIPLAKSVSMVGINFHNLGDLYREKGDLKKALGYTLKGRTIFEEIKHAKYLSESTNLIRDQLNTVKILSSVDLNEEEKRVARVRVAELKSLGDAANELGLSVQRIKELEEKIIAKLLS